MKGVLSRAIKHSFICLLQGKCRLSRACRGARASAITRTPSPRLWRSFPLDRRRAPCSPPRSGLACCALACQHRGAQHTQVQRRAGLLRACTLFSTRLACHAFQRFGWLSCGDTQTGPRYHHKVSRGEPTANARCRPFAAQCAAAQWSNGPGPRCVRLALAPVGGGPDTGTVGPRWSAPPL
jgi:hypothetical protein